MSKYFPIYQNQKEILMMTDSIKDKEQIEKVKFCWYCNRKGWYCKKHSKNEYMTEHDQIRTARYNE